MALSGAGQGETPQSLVTPVFAGFFTIVESGIKADLTTGMTTDRKIFDFPLRRGIMIEIEYPGVAQLVGRHIWDVEAARSSRATRTKAPRSIASGGFFLVYCGAGFEGDADFLRVLVICCRYAYNKKHFHYSII